MSGGHDDAVCNRQSMYHKITRAFRPDGKDCTVQFVAVGYCELLVTLLIIEVEHASSLASLATYSSVVEDHDD